VDFINRDYYWAYDEMIERLRPLLLTKSYGQLSPWCGA
jgi:hypothetical protein